MGNRINVKDSFKNIHEGKDIWIIGGGASLNYVNPSFFDNKITIGLNQAFTKFKYCTYYMKKDGAEWQGRNILEHIKEVSPESKLIMSDYVGCAKEWGHNDFSNIDWFNVDYYYFDHPCGHGEMDESVLPKVIEEGIFPNGISLTAIATAMAVFMGAKNIIICGNDECFLDGKDYFDEYVDKFECNLDHKSCLLWTGGQTTACVNYFRNLGYNIVGLNPFVNLLFEGHIYTREGGKGN